MKPDPTIEERLDLAKWLNVIAQEVAGRGATVRAERFRRIAAILRAPTRAPEEGTRIEGWAWCDDKNHGDGSWEFRHDENTYRGSVPAILILHASVTVDGEVTE